MRLLVSLVLLLCVGCDPVLPAPRAHPASGSSSVTLRFEPDASPDALPPVVWIEARSAAALQPSDLALVRGPVTDLQLRQLARGQPSAALSALMVPVTSFVRDGAVVLAPAVALADGPYTLAVGRLGAATALVVRDQPRAPRLRRAWPPADLGGAPEALVYCQSEPLPAFSIDAAFAPDGPSGSFLSDAGVGPRCARFSASSTGIPSPTGAIAPPPRIALGMRSWMLEPTPLAPLTLPPPELDRVSCKEGTVPIGPGCAFVDDDRIVITPPRDPLFWSLSGPTLARNFVTRDGEPLVIEGVSPSTDLALEVSVVDVAGAATSTTFGVHTPPAHPHVVLNEVYANPVGPEPAQEWVELFNDGSTAAELEGLVIEDVGGETVLPAAELAPGAFALVVPEAYDANDDLDPSPPTDALILRVPKLGKSGLSNSGEPLKLTTADGIVLSRFPGTPKPKSGVSVVRVSPEALDSAPSSFALSADGASPDAPNHPVQP